MFLLLLSTEHLCSVSWVGTKAEDFPLDLVTFCTSGLQLNFSVCPVSPVFHTCVAIAMFSVIIKVCRIFNVITIQKLKEMLQEGLAEFQGTKSETQF